MSEKIKQKMDLSRLKSLLDSLDNLEFLSEGEESVDFSVINNTHLKMLQLSNEPVKFISVTSSQQEINVWLLTSYAVFNLSDVFYLKTEDFPVAPWVKVKASGSAQKWLLPLYCKLTSGRLQLIPSSLESVFELRRQEHQFSTFVEKVHI
jgi:hypothetical protein